MNEIKTDYDSFLAEIYDYSPYFGKERREKDYATHFYLDNLPDKNKGKILELVTCTGLLTIPMARAGYKIDSIDVSPAVHEIVRRKMANEPKKVINNITLKCCNAFDYQTEYIYSAIVIPDSFLHAVADKQLQEELLKKCYKLLDDKGTLIIDIFVPWEDIISKGDVKQCTRFRTEQGELYIVYTHHLINSNNQTHRFDFVHEAYKSKKKFYHTIVYRYMYLSELIDLLQKTGFNIIKVDEHMNYGTNVAVVAQRKS